MRKILVAAILAASLTTASAQQQDFDVAPIIELFADQLPDIRNTVRKYDEAPEGGLLTYFDKDKYQKDLNKALDYAFSSIAPGIYQETRKRLFELDKALDKGRQERSELVIKMELAREGGDPSLVDRALGRNAPKGSREFYQSKIEKLDKEIAGVSKERETIIESFMDKLEDEYGLELSPKQAEAALYQLNGTAIVEAVVIGKMLLEVEKRLQFIVSKDIDQSVAKKYHGISAINRLLIKRMHERHLASYKEDWLPRLDKIEKENKKQAEEVKDTLKKAKSKANEEASRANLRTREKMAEIIVLYRKLLETRRTITEKAYEAAKEDAEV